MQLRQTDRRPLYAKIHIARKQLGMSDDIYRGMLEERFSVNSSSQLSVKQLILLLKHFEDLGFVPTANYAASADKKQLVKKVWALLYALNRPVPEYGNSLAKKMYGVDLVVWCKPPQLKGIITALAKQSQKTEKCK